jgi:ABC-2 type transport system permease protein
MLFRIYWNQLVMGLKLYTRIPSAIFWVFAFPVVMLLGMGTVFGSAGQQGLTLVWENEALPPDDPLRETLEHQGVKLEVLPPAEAEARWQNGKLAALMQGGQGSYKLRLNRYFAVQGMQISALLQQAYLVTQARLSGVTELARIPVETASPGGHRDGPYAAFLLPGLLGLNLLMMGVFSTGMVDVTLREKGGYKRLAVTPLPRSVYLAAQISVRILTMLGSAVALMVAGALVFGIKNQGSYLELLGLLLLGAACFMSMGYVLASLARTVESYNGIANLVFLPTMLLSGVYFSLDAAPRWLQKGADLLPLTPLLRAIRAVFNDGAGLAAHQTGLIVVAVWTVLLFGLAVRRFRWV